MTTPRLTLEQQKMLAQARSKTSAQSAKAFADANAQSYSRNPTVFVVYATGMSFEDKDSDKNKNGGIVHGYRFTHNGTKEYVELRIAMDKRIEHLNIKKAKNPNSAIGGVFDGDFEKEYFNAQVKKADGSFRTQKSNFLTKNEFYPDFINEDITKLYSHNEKTVCMVVDQPVRFAARKELIDGETVEVVMYNVRWVKVVPLGAYMTDNLYTNAVFSFRHKTFTTNATYKNKDNEIVNKPFASAANEVFVFGAEQGRDTAKHKVVAFSDKEGIKQIANLFTQSHDIYSYFQNRQLDDDHEYASAYDKFQTKLLKYPNQFGLGYKPFIMFALTKKITDTTAFASRKTVPTRELVIVDPITPERQWRMLSNTAVMEFELDENGEFIPYEDGSVFRQKRILNEQGEERDVYEIYSEADIEEEMNKFKERVLNPDEQVHKMIKEAYPDFDFEALTDDDFVMVGGKIYSTLGVSNEKIKALRNKFDAILTDETLTDEEREQRWENLINETYQSPDDYDKAMKQYLVFYHWDGSLVEEEMKGPAWAVRASTVRYPVVNDASKIAQDENDAEDKEISKEEKRNKRVPSMLGVLNGYNGVVVGGSLVFTPKQQTVSFYGSVNTAKPAYFSRTNVFSLLYAPEYNGDEKEGPLNIPEHMYKALNKSRLTESVHSDDKDNGEDMTTNENNAAKPVETSEDDINAAIMAQMAAPTETTKKSETKKVEEPIVTKVEEKIKEPVVTKPTTPIDTIDDDIPF